MSIPFKKFGSKPAGFPNPPSAREYAKDRNHLFKRRVLVYLESRGHGVLAAHPSTAVDELEEALSGIAYSEGRVRSSYDLHMDGGRTGPGELTDTEVGRLVTLAATFVQQTHSAEILAEYRRRGASGGRRSRRGPAFTMTMFEAVKDMSEAEAAKTLHCSRSTISRLRAAQRRRDPSSPQE